MNPIEWQNKTIARWHKQLLDVLFDLQPRILQLADELYELPELAYNEHQTSRSIYKWMSIDSIQPRVVAHTGIVADVGACTPHIAIIADMDAIEINGTPTHGCGHHAQMVHLLGLFMLFATVRPAFDFGLRFIAAPAEELVTSKARNTKLLNGQIQKVSGKAWLKQEGAFDGISALLSCHLADHEPERSITVGYNTSGCVVLVLALAKPGFSRTSESLWHFIKRQVTYWNAGLTRDRTDYLQIDSRVDLGALPDGIASVYLTWTTADEDRNERSEIDAIHFQELVRFAEGLAENLRYEFQEYLQLIEICKAYAPLKQDASISHLFAKHAEAVGYSVRHQAGSVDGYTDLGFLSQDIAVCHPLVGGTMGLTHTPEFRVVDPFAAYIMPIQALCGTIVELLANSLK